MTENVTILQYDSIAVNVVSIIPSCFGYSDGRAAVNQVLGGAGGNNLANYIYQWSKPNAPNTVSIDGLQGNKTYTVTVTDQEGCSGVRAFDVTSRLLLLYKRHMTTFPVSDLRMDRLVL